MLATNPLERTAMRNAMAVTMGIVVTGCAGTMGVRDAVPGNVPLLAHRGVAQQYDKQGLTRDTCTAERMLPPTHEHLENTLESMAAAFAAGADRVQFDVHPTSDGHFVAFHDWTVDCRTDGKGVTRQQALAYLKSLDIGHGYTADGGKTFPFRGKFRGRMPSFAEVMAAFPGKRFLVNIKSNSAEEARALAAHIRSRGDDVRLLAFSGADRPMEALREAFPEALVQSRAQLRRCLLNYVATGWLGHVSEACRNNVVYVPENYTWLIAGWPNRFAKRMAAVGSETYMAGPFQSGGLLRGHENAPHLPPGFAAGIVTDRIEVVGPQVRALAPARGPRQ